MANVTFGDLAGIPKYNQQMREAIKNARQKGDTDGKTSESEDDGAGVIRKNPRKVPIRQTKQPKRVKSQPTFRLYGKVGRQNIQMMIDTGAELTVCTKPLAKKLGLDYRKDKAIELITVDGKKNKTCGVAEEASIKIADAAVLMNIHIADSKDKAFLIGGDWLNRYQADILYSKKEITFRAQGRKFTVKLTTATNGMQKVNYFGVGDTPPPVYQPTIEVSEEESEAETFTSTRTRITNILEELEQRETRGNQPITKQKLEDKINVWMIKCEEMKQHICQYKAEELLIIPKDDVIGEIEGKMGTAKWEEIEGESPTGYLAKTEPIEREEEI